MLGDSLGPTDGKVLDYDEGIKLGLFDDEVLGTILVNVYGITLDVYVGTYMGSSDGYFDVSNIS